MGYQYLVKTHRDINQYLLVDGRNDSLMFFGERSDYFDPENEWISEYVSDAMFDECDEQGSTDVRMDWDNSTYITADGYSFTRENIIDVIDTLDDNLRYTAESKPFLLPSRNDDRVFGGMPYAELVVGAASVGIDRETVDAFAQKMKSEGRRTYAGYTRASGFGLFAAARDFGGENTEDVLGWAAMFATVLSDDDSLSSFAEKSNGKFIIHFFEDFRTHDWRDFYDMLTLLSTQDSRTNGYEFTSLTDLVTEDGFDAKDVIALMRAGHRGRRTITNLLKSGVDAELASKLVG